MHFFFFFLNRRKSGPNSEYYDSTDSDNTEVSSPATPTLPPRFSAKHLPSSPNVSGPPYGQSPSFSFHPSHAHPHSHSSFGHMNMLVNTMPPSSVSQGPGTPSSNSPTLSLPAPPLSNTNNLLPLSAFSSPPFTATHGFPSPQQIHHLQHPMPPPHSPHQLQLQQHLIQQQLQHQQQFQHLPPHQQPQQHLIHNTIRGPLPPGVIPPQSPISQDITMMGTKNPAIPLPPNAPPHLSSSATHHPPMNSSAHVSPSSSISASGQVDMPDEEDVGGLIAERVDVNNMLIQSLLASQLTLSQLSNVANSPNASHLPQRKNTAMYNNLIFEELAKLQQSLETVSSICTGKSSFFPFDCNRSHR